MLDAIKNRHSVRSYKNNPLAKESLEPLVEALRLAPSGNNEQAWKFIVITGDKRQEVALACDQDFVAEAPVLVVALSEKSKDDYNMAFAVDHLLLEATHQGLGTCVIRSFTEQQVKDVLNISDNYYVFAIVTVGYPLAEIQANTRKSLDEVVCWETFH